MKNIIGHLCSLQKTSRRISTVISWGFVVQLSQCYLFCIRDYGEAISYRAYANQGMLPSVRLLAMASARPSSDSLKKVDHEYSLKRESGPVFVSRTLSLTTSVGFLPHKPTNGPSFCPLSLWLPDMSRIFCGSAPPWSIQ